MVRKSEWSDNQLEELLREMPKIEDHRNPRDIYQNIESRLKRRKKKAWVVPSVATAAAFLLFLLLSPTLTNWQNSADQSMESTNESAGSEEAKMEMSMMKENEEVIEEETNDVAMDSVEVSDGDATHKSFVADSHTALYEEDIMEDQEVLTFAIPDKNAQIAVPVSITVPKEEGKTKFELFTEAMPKLKEEEWGLSEYYPLNATLEYNEDVNELLVDVPEGHYYGDGAASENAFKKVLNDSLNMLNIDKVILSTEGNRGIMLGNTGVLNEYTPQVDTNHAYYFYYPFEGSVPYLVPYLDTHESLEEALEAMKNDIETHGLKASIPSNLEFEVDTPTKELIVIRLEDQSELGDSSKITYMVEAILLTAKDFDFKKVKIENAPTEQAGKFVFNEEWKVPVAPNKKYIME
ncbi:negative regulator of sigma-X activity [Cytobacillus sp. FJAT-54145]|uniref:Negative regulator of sigma-X activity n=1 Tax=Cytobacillus spartinae TaxID=3299023 RepID=A0ABW6KEN3_9BACI